MRVAVIGAGSAGLSALRHLSSNPFFQDPVAFELSDRAGGTWIYSDLVGKDKHGLPVFSSMYKNLRTNIPKEVMAFPDFPFKDTGRSFIHHSEVLKYLDNYKKHFDIEKYIRFETYVLSIRPINPKAPMPKWEVIYKRLGQDENLVEEFDAVLVCSGHYSVPRMPKIEGLETFEGSVSHSHDYKVSDPFSDKVVLCLGAGASAIDIAVEASQVAKKVYLSHRMKENFSTALPSNMEQVACLKSIQGKTVLLADDRELQIDELVLCTGYEFHYPFIHEDCKIKIDRHRMTPLYKHLINIEYTNFGIVGVPFLICPFPQFDVQVQFFLKNLTGEVKLLSKEEMLKEEERDYQWRMNDLGFPHRWAHKMGPLQWGYNEEIARLAGVPPVPPVIQKLYEFVHKKRVKNVLTYRDDNFQVLDYDSFAVVNGASG